MNGLGPLNLCIGRLSGRQLKGLECIKNQSIVTDAGLAQPGGEAPVQDWLASFAAQQNLQRLADTLGQRPLTPLGDVGVAGGFRV